MRGRTVDEHKTRTRSVAGVGGHDRGLSARIAVPVLQVTLALTLTLTQLPPSIQSPNLPGSI